MINTQVSKRLLLCVVFWIYKKNGGIPQLALPGAVVVWW